MIFNQSNNNRGKNVIVINGNRIEVDGNLSGVSISNGEIRVGGVVIQSGLSGNVHVTWDGPVTSLTTDGSATVNGEVGGSVSAGGSVTCGDVKLGVNAGGSVKCGRVGGSLNAGGSVKIN